MRIFAICFALALLAAPAFAQTPAPAADKEAIAGVAGQYEVSNADHDQICPMTLRADPGPAASSWISTALIALRSFRRSRM